MPDRLIPYLFFLLATALFLFFGAGLQLLLPVQVALIVAEVGCLLGFALFMRHHWKEPAPMGWPSWRRLGGPLWLLVLTFLSGGIFGLCANLLGGLFVELVPGMEVNAEQYAETLKKMLRPDSLALQIAAYVSVVVFAPLCEEFLFRGFLLPLQRERERVGQAILFNGVLFGALHMNAMGMLSLSLLGAALAALTVRSRSIWPAIACHAGVNTCNGVIIPTITLAMGIDPMESSPPLGELLVATACFGVFAAASLGVLWRGYGKYADEPSQE